MFRNFNFSLGPRKGISFVRISNLPFVEVDVWQALGKACDRIHTSWHTPTTSEVYKILRFLIALKLQAAVTSSLGFYDDGFQCSLLAISADFKHPIPSEIF